MRTKEQFENERYYGIQKFETQEEAFKVMNGEWGAPGADVFTKLVIADDEEFPKVILKRAIMKWLEYKYKKITLKECRKSFSQTDYLLRNGQPLKILGMYKY